MKHKNGGRKQDGVSLKKISKIVDLQHGPLVDLKKKKKASKIATDLLKAIPRVFPACTDGSIIQTRKHKMYFIYLYVCICGKL